MDTLFERTSLFSSICFNNKKLLETSWYVVIPSVVDTVLDCSSLFESRISIGLLVTTVSEESELPSEKDAIKNGRFNIFWNKKFAIMREKIAIDIENAKNKSHCKDTDAVIPIVILPK